MLVREGQKRTKEIDFKNAINRTLIHDALFRPVGKHIVPSFERLQGKIGKLHMDVSEVWVVIWRSEDWGWGEGGGRGLKQTSIYAFCC